MRLTIRVTENLVPQGVEDLTTNVPRVGRLRMRTVMNRIVRRMQVYPPEPKGQSKESSHPILGKIFTRAKGRYQRTGLFGRSWKIEDVGDGYQISNTAARKAKLYGHYVVGDAYGTGQAWMHKGRWNLFRDVVDEENAKLPPEVIDDINMVARRYAE